ncbi:MAG: glycine cleavage system protein H [Deltaproteobacteria bacterium]|nr:glycine cleavage system protein H [Deltaproteobacteria bacterium]
MSSPQDLRYTKSHEWVRREGDTVVVGITHYAQNSLGDVVHVEMPEEGDAFEQGAEAAEIESVKAVSSIYAPVSGTVLGINEAIEDGPEVVNDDAYGEGWLFKLSLADASELESLMSAEAYGQHIEAEG